MTSRRQRLGRRGEEVARRHLEANGYAVLETNYRAKGGEIDLVAKQAETLVFVEVKARQGRGFGLPEESVTLDKRARLVAAAQEYLEAHAALDAEWRIDVVALELDARGRLRRLEVIENAVEL